MSDLDPKVFLRLIEIEWSDAMDRFFDEVVRQRGDLTPDEIRDALVEEYGEAVLEEWDQWSDEEWLDGPGNLPRSLNPAYCGHERTGLICNQNPDEPYDDSQPYTSASVCERPQCRDRVTRYVAASTNRQAHYFDDAERRAAKVGASRP